MKDVVLAELQVGNSEQFIYQRRDGKAPTAPHRLGWFGGHRNLYENPIDCIRRELSEETSLEIARLLFSKPRIFEVPAEHASSKELTFVTLFNTRIKPADTNFEVYEGTRAEIFTHAGLLATNEVASTVRYILEQMEA